MTIKAFRGMHSVFAVNVFWFCDTNLFSCSFSYCCNNCNSGFWV